MIYGTQEESIVPTRRTCGRQYLIQNELNKKHDHVEMSWCFMEGRTQGCRWPGHAYLVEISIRVQEQSEIGLGQSSTAVP